MDLCNNPPSSTSKTEAKTTTTTTKRRRKLLVSHFGLILAVLASVHQYLEFRDLPQRHTKNPPTNEYQAIHIGKTLRNSMSSITETTPIKTTESNTTNQNGSLYWCGFGNQGLSIALFPDYAEHSFSLLTNTSTPTSNDVLVFGVHGPCDFHPLVFPGKLLFLNGESFGGDWTRTTIPGSKETVPHRGIDNVYQIGLVPDSPHSVVAYFGAVMIPNAFSHQFHKLANLESKAKNNGQNNALIYVASNCVPHRQEAVKKISRFMTVHYGGKCRGSSGTRAVPSPEMSSLGPGEYVKLPDVYSKYKFCLAMENTKVVGYVTEKIILTFLGGCIPVYYGADDIFDIFNPQAFVYYDVNNPKPALAKLRYLLKHEDAYMDMLHNQSIFVNGSNTVQEYFSFSDDIGGGYLKHKIRVMMGIDSA